MLCRTRKKQKNSALIRLNSNVQSLNTGSVNVQYNEFNFRRVLLVDNKLINFYD